MSVSEARVVEQSSAFPKAVSRKLDWKRCDSAMRQCLHGMAALQVEGLPSSLWCQPWELPRLLKKFFFNIYIYFYFKGKFTERRDTQKDLLFVFLPRLIHNSFF